MEIRNRSPTVMKKTNRSGQYFKAIEKPIVYFFTKNRKDKEMDKEKMININANLANEPTFSSFEQSGETVEVANFTIVKKYGKGKEYINCAAYGKKAETAKNFEKGNLIHVFGYFKEREKDGKTYKNFVVKSYNKIEKKEENEEEE